MPAQPKSAMRTRRQDKSSQRYQARKARRACVEAVWKRAGNYCEHCEARVQRASAYGFMLGHVHEVKFRSLGGDPTDPDNCLLLCANRCHPLAHRLKVSAHRRSVRAV